MREVSDTTMTDIFSDATKSIFQTQIARDAIYTDENQNVMSVRVIERTEVKTVYDDYTARPITIGKTISMLLPDAVMPKINEQIQIDNKVYSITNCLENDGMVVELELK